MEITAEAMPGDLCHDKFEQEMNTVDLVSANVNVTSEDSVSIVKKRGRPKKIESPLTDGKTISVNFAHFIYTPKIFF